MKVDDRHVAWMRAMLDGRIDEVRRIGDELKAAGAVDPFIPYLHYAFFVAIRKLSGGEYTRSWVVTTVAALRSVLDGTPAVIDPVAAESEIFRALGDQSVPQFPDGDARMAAQIPLLRYAIDSLELSDAEVQDLLTQAQTMADLELAASEAKARADELQARYEESQARVEELEARLGYPASG